MRWQRPPLRGCFSRTLWLPGGNESNCANVNQDAAEKTPTHAQINVSAWAKTKKKKGKKELFGEGVPRDISA